MGAGGFPQLPAGFDLSQLQGMMPPGFNPAMMGGRSQAVDPSAVKGCVAGSVTLVGMRAERSVRSLSSFELSVEADNMPSYQIIYPIYIDAKRPAKSGERRVPLSHAVAWPQAQHMVQACAQLGLKAVLDVRDSVAFVRLLFSARRQLLCHGRAVTQRP